MIESYARFFENLTSDFSDDHFRSVFSNDAIFEDPFQKVAGLEKIIVVFRHMYTTVENPRFEIIETIGDQYKGYIRWRFYYDSASFEGVSRVEFNEEGKATLHIDYWDAASNIYERIPLLGSFLRFIKKRLKAS